VTQVDLCQNEIFLMPIKTYFNLKIQLAPPLMTFVVYMFVCTRASSNIEELGKRSVTGNLKYTCHGNSVDCVSILYNKIWLTMLLLWRVTLSWLLYWRNITVSKNCVSRNCMIHSYVSPSWDPDNHIWLHDYFLGNWVLI
jgi:hypothetical protein